MTSPDPFDFEEKKKLASPSPGLHSDWDESVPEYYSQQKAVPAESGSFAQTGDSNQSAEHLSQQENSSGMLSGRTSAFGDALIDLWIDFNNKALVVKTITAINVLIFIAMAVVSTGQSIDQPTTSFLISWGANAGTLTLNGEYWRIVSAAFLHSGWMHIAMNMVILWDIGPLVERIYGSRRFLFIYLFAAVTASLNSLFWKPDVVSVGASGAVFGIFGALLAFYHAQRASFPPTLIRDKSRIVLAVIAYNLIFGMLRPNIDNAGHVGGLIGGFIIAVILAPSAPLERRLRLKELIGATVAIALCYGLWKVDEKTPMDPEGKFEVQTALTMLEAGKTTQAKALLDNYIDVRQGKEPSAYLVRAALLMDSGKSEEALKNIETAIKLDPKFPNAYYLKADLMLQRNQYEESIRAASKALELKADYKSALIVRSAAFSSLGRAKEALSDVDNYLKLEPDSQKGKELRAIILKQLARNGQQSSDGSR